ncbi:MAG: hypothetical protein ACTSU5_10565 [Promethearchaeota archaeon]
MSTESIEVVVGFISLGPLIAGLILGARTFFREKHRHLLYLTVMSGFAGLACLFEILLNLTGRFEFNALYRACMLVTALFTFLLVDTLSRESVDALKIGFFSFFVGGFTIMFLLDAATTVGWIATPSSGSDAVNYFVLLVTNVHHYGYLAIYAFILFIMCMTFLAWSVKVYRSVPANLKKPALLVLGGGVVVGSLPFVGLLSEFVVPIPGSDIALAATGIIMIGIALGLEPKLAYVLPFKTYRLTVVDNQAGISIYNQVWATGAEDSEVTDDDLFSGMLQGIGSFVQESMKKGGIREIHLEHAILILEGDPKHEVQFVLVVSKTSRVLRDALAAFRSRFLSEFGEALKDRANTTQFKGVQKIMEECFPFVPDFEKAPKASPA